MTITGLRVLSSLRQRGAPHGVAVSEEGSVATIKTTSAAQAAAFWADLTPKERQVGISMARGWTNSEISYRLELSPKTVDTRISAIYEKLPEIPGVHRRAHAVLLIRSAIGGGPLELDHTSADGVSGS